MRTAIYVRVSTEEQSVDAQLQSITTFLKNKGISDYQIYQDVGVSGTKASRPALNTLLNDCKGGAIELVVVYKLDRLFRSLSHLISTLNAFSSQGIKFVAVQDNIDLTSPAGILMMHMLGAFAQFERDLIVERTKAGIKAAKAKGIHCGRPVTYGTQIENVIYMGYEPGMSVRHIAKQYGISRTTAQRLLKKVKERIKISG